MLGVLLSLAQSAPDSPAQTPGLSPEDIFPSRSLEAESKPDLSPSRLASSIKGRSCQDERHPFELDQLFFQLKHAAQKEDAARLARQIQAVWARTGSETLDVLMQWAEAATEKEDYPQAIDFIDNIIALAPTCFESFMRRASIHIQRHDLSAAVLDLNEVLRREPRHYNAMMQLGVVMEMLEKPQKAIKLYEKALELYPQSSRLQKRLGRLLEAIDDNSV